MVLIEKIACVTKKTSPINLTNNTLELNIPKVKPVGHILYVKK